MKISEVTNESWEFKIDHPEKQKQGIHLYYQGCPYPRRVYYDRLNDPNHGQRALEALGTVKKFLFSLTYLKDVVFPRTLKIKKWQAFLDKLYTVVEWQLLPYYVEDDEWSVPVYEIGILIRQFLEALGFETISSFRWAKAVMCFLEYDNAYRYRAQDLLGAVTYLDRSSLEYIGNIYAQRENIPGAKERITQVLSVLKKALWIPKFRKALEKAQIGVDFNKIRFDKNDRFHFSFWMGYDYEGKTFEERFAPYEELYKTIPFRKRESPELTAKFMTE